MCEDLGRYYSRRWGISTIALRLGMFVPETFERYGFRLLFGGVDDRDVAQAVMRALAHAPTGGFDAFNIMADVPFTQADAQSLHDDLAGMLERSFPGMLALIQQPGLNLSQLVWGQTIWPIAKDKRRLPAPVQF